MSAQVSLFSTAIRSAAAAPRRIVLVGCGKAKRPDVCAARELYVGSLFRASLRYAEGLGAERVFIVSARYHLLRLEDLVGPYDQTLADRPSFDRLGWGENVAKRLENWADPDRSRSPYAQGKPNRRVRVSAVLLAGATYAEPLRAAFAVREGWTLEEPLAGLTLGRRLQFLSRGGVTLAAPGATEGQ